MVAHYGGAAAAIRVGFPWIRAPHSQWSSTVGWIIPILGLPCCFLSCVFVEFFLHHACFCVQYIFSTMTLQLGCQVSLDQSTLLRSSLVGWIIPTLGVPTNVWHFFIVSLSLSLASSILLAVFCKHWHCNGCQVSPCAERTLLRCCVQNLLPFLRGQQKLHAIGLRNQARLRESNQF